MLKHLECGKLPPSADLVLGWEVHFTVQPVLKYALAFSFFWALLCLPLLIRIFSQSARDVRRSYLVILLFSHFQDLPFRFLADPPLPPIRPQPQARRTVFPLLGSYQVCHFSGQVCGFLLRPPPQYPKSSPPPLAAKLLVFVAQPYPEELSQKS